MPAPLQHTHGEFFERLESRRTQALVQRDWATAKALHAEDYELITPGGVAMDLPSYLSAIENGSIAYTRWVLGPMKVRATEAMAVIRYPAELVFESGTTIHCWHTDSYELRGGQWRAVWSQATARKRVG